MARNLYHYMHAKRFRFVERIWVTSPGFTISRGNFSFQAVSVSICFQNFSFPFLSSILETVSNFVPFLTFHFQTFHEFFSTFHFNFSFFDFQSCKIGPENVYNLEIVPDTEAYKTSELFISVSRNFLTFHFNFSALRTFHFTTFQVQFPNFSFQARNSFKK